MGEWPTGTVTFLFTDIEGSTKLWEQHPGTMPVALARHDDLLTEAIQQHGGVVVKNRGEGDSFFAVFARATDAVAAAWTLQQALLAEPWPPPLAPPTLGGLGGLRVRVALHTGEADQRGGDYYGASVNRCARVRAVAHGGQVLLSQATAERVREHLPEGGRSGATWGLRDLGSHRLKDLQQPEHLYQLLHPDLPADFPPLRSLAAFAHNLPAQVTRFIGREREMGEVKVLLATTRLLTLTGSGGCGKTRLALQVVAEVLEEYLDGVWLVELAALADPNLVPQTVAAALGVREEPNRPLLATLADYLRPRSLLLLLDNCEHLLATCAQLADTLLRACPNLTVLASSREGLGIAGEQTYRVPSLSLPDPQRLPPPERLREIEAVQLFADRAGLAQPSFAVTAANAVPVAQVCERLDGIPLAIELAAARVKVLPVEQIVARLDDRFRLLTGGSRTALPRQQTLRALIDWSYDLLSEPERALLRRLSVFAGGWTLEAAETVGAGGEIEEWEVLDRLTALVDKSLVVVEEQSGETRYRLLETVRQYARDRLLEAGEAATVRERHLDWYLALAERAEPEFRGAEQLVWLNRLEAEHDNLRAALEWSQSGDDRGEAGLRLIGALGWFWGVRCHWGEMRSWIERVLASTEESGRTAVRARVLCHAGTSAWVQGDWVAARPRLEESLAIWRELGNQEGVASSLIQLAIVTHWLGDPAAALAQIEESVTLYRQGKDKWGLASALHIMAARKRNAGDYVGARVCVEESLALIRETGNPWGLCLSLSSMGGEALRLGDYAAARSFFEESLALARKVGDKWTIAGLLEALGNVSRCEGDYARAVALYKESLARHRDLTSKGSISQVLYLLGYVAQDQGKVERAARLLGAAEGLFDALGCTWDPDERAELERHMAAVRTTLGEEAFAAAWAAGQVLSLDQAVEYALADANDVEVFRPPEWPT